MNARQTEILGNLNEFISRTSSAKNWGNQITSGEGFSDVPALKAEIQAKTAEQEAQLVSLQRDYNMLNEFGEAQP